MDTEFEVEEVEDEVEETEDETLTVKEVAAEIGTTGRLLRRFIRSEVVADGGTVGEDTPGKGRRYSFTRDEADSLIERWEAAMAPADEEELEDARWFPCGRLPTGPGRHSIARYIIDNYGQA